MTELVTITPYSEAKGITKIKFAFTAAADGTATGETVSAYTGFIYYVVSDPGTTAPTTLWDFQLQDEDNYDTLGGAGADRSATVTEFLQMSSDGLGDVLDSKLTLEVSGAGSGGDGIIIVHIMS